MKFPQLALMVKGLFSAASAAAYGVVLLGIVLTIWGVFAVHFIQPVVDRISLAGGYAGCERCHVAFASVRNSMLTFTQQIIAGDSWGQVTLPIIEESPTTSLFFLSVFVSMNFTIMNVILAVIVDSALKASQGDVDEVLKQKQESAVVAKDFRDILTTMDIKAEDMSVVFSILDQDGNGTVEADEFMNELFKMKSHDSHTLLVFIKHYSMEIKKDVQAQLGLLKTGMDNICKLFIEELMHKSITVDQREQMLQSIERGAELSRPRSVVSEDRLGSMQHLLVNLNLEEGASKAGKADERRQLPSVWTQLDKPEPTLLHKPSNLGALGAGSHTALDSVQITPRDGTGLRVPSSVWGIRNIDSDGGPANRVRSSPDGHMASPSDDPRIIASAPSLHRTIH